MSQEWRLGSDNNHITFPGLVLGVFLFILFTFIAIYGEDVDMMMKGEKSQESVAAEDVR